MATEERVLKYASPSHPCVVATEVRVSELVRVAKEWQLKYACEVRVAKEWQPKEWRGGVRVLKYASPSHPWKALGLGDRAKQDLCKLGVVWFDVISGFVGRCVWGPVDRGKVPMGMCDWTYVVDFERPMPYIAMGAQVHQEAGGKQPGDHYQPGSCWEVHQPGSWWIRSWQSGRSLRAR